MKTIAGRKKATQPQIQAIISKDKQTPTAKREKLKNKLKASRIDMFTVICKSDLRIVVEKEHIFHPIRKWRFDYAILECKIAVEVEGGVYTGGRHTRPLGFLGDMEKYNAATLLGWRIFRVTPTDLLKNKTFDLIKQAILKT